MTFTCLLPSFRFPSLFSVFLLLLALSASAQSPDEIDHYHSLRLTPLWDTLQDGTYDLSAYLLPHTITVDSGKTMSIGAGSVLYCASGSGITVRGKLLCLGDRRHPIPFRRMPPTMYFRPQDMGVVPQWEGIRVEQGGELEMRWCLISESVRGIAADTGNAAVLLDSVVFRDNEFFSLRVGGDNLRPPEGAPVNYHIFGNAVQSRSTGKESRSGGTGEPEKNRKKSWKTPVRVGLACLAAGSAGAWLGGHLAYQSRQKEYLSAHGDAVPEARALS